MTRDARERSRPGTPCSISPSASPRLTAPFNSSLGKDALLSAVWVVRHRRRQAPLIELLLGHLQKCEQAVPLLAVGRVLPVVIHTVQTVHLAEVRQVSNQPTAQLFLHGNLRGWEGHMFIVRH